MSLTTTETVSSQHGRPCWRAWHWLALLLGLAALLYGGTRLLGMSSGVEVSQARVGDLPLTLYQPRQDDEGQGASVPGPTVVIAHGFAGSRQLMRSFALNLARNGYRAVSFDFPGHGTHGAPLGGGLGSPERLSSLLDALTQAVAFAQGQNLPGGSSPLGQNSPEEPHQSAGLALLGHSMAGDILIHYAKAHPGVKAIVAVSPYLSEPIGADFTPDLLFVYGAYEPEMIHQQGFEAMAEVAPSGVELETTYGDLSEGRARRLVMADGVEHIGVLFNGQAQREALDWLDASFGRRTPEQPPARAIVTAGAGLGWLYAGLCLLAWPLSLLLPAMASRPLGAALRWRKLAIAGFMPALLTPLLLWPVPSDFLPLLIGDYLALHFLLYGLLTWGALALVGGLPDGASFARAGRASTAGVLAIGATAWLIYAVVGFGWPTHQLVASFFPPLTRLPSFLALLLGTLVYASADAWLVHGQGGARAASLFTKVLFLLSLVLAVVLNLDELFFLVIIVPAILLLFVVYGWLDFLSYRRTWQPLLGAIASALVFALTVTATFPVVA
ncbi:alpha/beta hydrolase [Thiorhodovibrio frisius]|uniref:Lysophospholipase n=1 Tax=Thiorhodovibrio frisius TaxID=631362 RepID=H8Z4A7_9GAMM|nr:alpha/beta hydrolase [Thiorhodovibrio frisius]EIC20164.1 lysophospholipase [Thiorhodovibrio frisius]WPL20901.1 putative dienelactone hydrolase [Thiorhodovibrio frisius]